MPLREGSKIGPYEVTAPLGAGGMGEVWRARDPRLRRDVAIKVLPDDALGDASSVSRLHAEARAASALNHPNIVAIYDIGDDAGRTYLAMELLEGANLRRLLDSGRPALHRALQIALQIAAGLAAAHARGIVHRDLKPENVFLTADDVVKILDFGLAKNSPLDPALGENDPTMSAGTSPGTLLGTIAYMSPEQASGRPVDFRSDLFSFGSIFYELLTGHHAWKGKSPTETLIAIVRDDPPPVSTAEVPVPDAVRRVVEKCLAKDPDDRYASTRDLTGDLRYALEHFSELKSAPALPASARPKDRGGSRRGQILGIASLTVLVALAGAVWVRFRPVHAAFESLAVLPFENGTREPDSDYLSDGITEIVIDKMSRLASLSVMARATVFRYKGSKDALEAGRKLGVQTVVTGSVVRSGSRLSVSAELVDVRTGARLWGERYDRPMADLVRVQDAIASDISDALRLRLTGPEKRALGRHGTENAEAYELFLKGRYYFWKDTEEGYIAAGRLFDQATEKDPKFAEAYSWAAQMGGLMAVGGYVPPAEGWARQVSGARKALALSPGLPSARFAIVCRRAFFDWDVAGAVSELQEILAEPMDLVGGVDARPVALLLWSRGRLDEALATVEKARLADPGNSPVAIALADYLAKAGRLDDAARTYRSVMADDPSDPRPLFGLAEVLKRQGDVAAAVDVLRNAYELTGEDEGVKALANAPPEKAYAAAQVAVARLRLADLMALAKTRYVSPLDLARLEAQVGEREKAFEHLEAAFAERSAGLVLLKVDPALDLIRDDPRFAALVARVGIP